MINYTKLFNYDLFSISQKNKNKIFFKNLKILHKHHYKNCKEFRLVSESLFKNKKVKKIEDLPYLHVSIFKENNLSSINKNLNTTTYYSSGTSGSKLSQINIDRTTSLLQSKSLYNLLMSVLKKKRKKIFIIDSENNLKKSKNTAREAAIYGFKQLAESSEFLLNKNNSIKIDLIKKISNENDYIFFGFTSNIYEYFLRELIKKKIKINKNNSTLFHGGGWKKIQEQSINPNKFNSLIKKYLGICRIHNYYGMIEQTGSIFLECEYGYYHSSIFSEINIRNENLELCNKNQKGIIQVSSLLPISYPGHNILTEDIGMLIGIDDCKCGRKGKYFKVFGRVPQSEIRGCSDVY